jgi:hypothetical protein
MTRLPVTRESEPKHNTLWLTYKRADLALSTDLAVIGRERTPMQSQPMTQQNSRSDYFFFPVGSSGNNIPYQPRYSEETKDYSSQMQPMTPANVASMTTSATPISFQGIAK